MAAFLFDSLADEYYDPELHPTCANFRSGSLILVERFLRSVGPMGGIWCDLGAGNSVLLEVIERTLLTDEPFVIAVDGSAQMLDQTPSKRWHDAAPVVALVEHLPLDSSSVS
jgi:hypothetical protein